MTSKLEHSAEFSNLILEQRIHHTLKTSLYQQILSGVFFSRHEILNLFCVIKLKEMYHAKSLVCLLFTFCAPQSHKFFGDIILKIACY